MILSKKTIVAFVAALCILVNSTVCTFASPQGQANNTTSTSTEYTTVPDTWTFVGEVGGTSYSLPATYVESNLKTGGEILRPYWFVNFENFDDGSSNSGDCAITPYVSKQLFSADGNRFIIGRNNLGDSSGTLYEYNIQSQSVRLLHEGVKCKDANEVTIAGDGAVTVANGFNGNVTLTATIANKSKQFTVGADS